MLSTRDPLQSLRHIQTESERMEKDIPCKWKKKKKAGLAILLSEKINLKIKTIIRDKEGHYQMIKGSVQEKDIIILTVYVPNIRAPQYIR